MPMLGDHHPLLSLFDISHKFRETVPGVCQWQFGHSQKYRQIFGTWDEPWAYRNGLPRRGEWHLLTQSSRTALSPPSHPRRLTGRSSGRLRRKLTTPPEPRTAGAAFALVGPPEDLKSAIEADDVRGTFDIFHSGDGIVDPGRIPDVRDGVELGEDLHVRRVRARKVDGKRGLCAPSTCHWRHRHATDKAEPEDERQISAPAVGEGGPEPVPGDQVSSPTHGAVPSSNGSLTSWSTHRDRLVLSPPQRGIRVTWSQGSYPVRPSRASTTRSTDRMTPTSALLATPVEHGFGFTRNVGHVAFPSTAARQRRDQADQSKMFPAVAAHDAVLSLE